MRSSDLPFENKSRKNPKNQIQKKREKKRDQITYQNNPKNRRTIQVHQEKHPKITKMAPKRSNSKLIIAATLVTFFNIGVYFSVNIKQFLADRYLHYFNITPQDVEHIESNICTTATIMSIFMGLLIKWTSPSIVCMLSNFALFLVTVAIDVAVDLTNFNAVLFISYIRGIMIEGIFLAQATLTVDLFTGQILSLIIGMANVANSLTTAVSSTLTPKIFLWGRSIPFCFFIGSLVAWLALLLTVIWWILEIRGWGKDIALSPDEEDNEAEEVEGDQKKAQGGEIEAAKNKEFEENIPLAKLEELAEDKGDSTKESSYSDLWDFNIWLNCINYALGTTNEVIFNSFGNELFVRRFGFNIEQAGLIMSIIPLLTIPFTPMYSAISMKYGKKTPTIMVGFAAAAVAFIYTSFLPSRLSSIWELAIPIFLYSQFLSISHAFLYTNIGLVSSSRIVSIAFGISSLFFGIFYVAETNLFGLLLKPDTAGVYQSGLLIVAGLHVAGFLTTLWVFWIDMRRGKVLYLPENSTEVMDMKKKIDKGYLWFKENYLKNKRGKGTAGTEKLSIAATTTNYTLNGRLTTEKRDGVFGGDRLAGSVAKRTIVTGSDEQEIDVDQFLKSKRTMDNDDEDEDSLN